MTIRTFNLLAAGIAWLASFSLVAANEANTATLPKLRQGGELSCQPTLPHFCENVHVRCSGQTTVPTFEFKLRNPTNAGTVQLTTIAEDFQRQYESPNVEWDKGGSYVLLSPKASNGYIKLHSDGKYVLRHYIQGLGVMSLGHCK